MHVPKGCISATSRHWQRLRGPVPPAGCMWSYTRRHTYGHYCAGLKLLGQNTLCVKRKKRHSCDDEFQSGKLGVTFATHTLYCSFESFRCTFIFLSGYSVCRDFSFRLSWLQLSSKVALTLQVSRTAKTSSSDSCNSFHIVWVVLADESAACDGEGDVHDDRKIQKAWLLKILTYGNKTVRSARRIHTDSHSSVLFVFVCCAYRDFTMSHQVPVTTERSVWLHELILAALANMELCYVKNTNISHTTVNAALTLIKWWTILCYQSQSRTAGLWHQRG